MKLITSILFAAACTLSGPAAANIFLELPGIDGEATAVGHEKWIEVSSFQFGVGNSNPAAGSTPSVSDVTVTKLMDSASPPLLEAVMTGKSFASALFDFTTSSGGGKDATYLEYQLSNVFLTGYAVSSGGDRPSESLSMNWAKLKMTYFPTLPSGALGQPIVANIQAVPEPSTWVVLAAGLLLVGIRAGRAARRIS